MLIVLHNHRVAKIMYLFFGNALAYWKSVWTNEAEADKDLGVWIDNQLTFSVYVAKSAAKANSLIGIICRSFKYLYKDSLPLLYTATIRPHIKYANSFCWPLTKALQHAIEKVQHRATKMVMAIKDLPYGERLCQLNLLSVASVICVVTWSVCLSTPAKGTYASSWTSIAAQTPDQMALS